MSEAGKRINEMVDEVTRRWEADRVRLAQAEARIRELEQELAQAEDDHAHDVWDSCGCLGGAGVGHARNSPECPFPEPNV